MTTQHEWLQGSVVYQIYPRSFRDEKGTGIGDLQGIIRKLDYLGGTPESLNVTAMWISPIYTSPMADFGYDVADYCDVDPIYGSIQDFKILVSEAHKRSIKVLMDFVPNHTSEKHPWFISSQSSLDDPKRDWYIWRSPKANGSPPNNWLSVFGGSAWQFSEQTNQYYLHSFLSQQPDLNWDNPAVRTAMKSAMRFWLDLGVDGFRIDAVDWMSKDEKLRDDPINIEATDKIANYDHDSLQHSYSRDGPQLFERLNEMTSVLEEYKDRFMITEAHPETDNTIKGYLKYYQGVNPHLSAPFNFQSIYLPWQAPIFRNFIDSFQAVMKPGYTPIYTIGNHDESRIATRIGPEAARTAAMMLLTLPGMAIIYYGDELGMTDVPIPEDKIHDPFASSGIGRDPARTPMQWNNSSYAGFSKVEPWLPVAANYTNVNVKTELKDDASLLNLYRRLIHVRSQSKVLKNGNYQPMNVNEHILSYKRNFESDTLLILLNFSNSLQDVRIKHLHGLITLSTYLDTANNAIDEHVQMRPNEGLIIKIRT